MKTRILWSGVTGRTGLLALEKSKMMKDVEIVAGICRNNREYYNYNDLRLIKEEFDIIVDFSHAESFDKILDLALNKKIPIIIGTAGLSLTQEDRIHESANKIPVFRGGNFQFKVKEFIDEIVEYSKTCEGEIELIETHYKSKKIPSETAKVVKKRVFAESGKNVKIRSILKYDELINNWRVEEINCRVVGFEKLAENVLEIAKLMKNKPAEGIYDLNRLVDPLPEKMIE